MTEVVAEARGPEGEENLNTAEAGYQSLKERFPDAVSDDAREGYSGILVDATHLPEVATAIRDQLGYDYLSSATAVDHLGLEGECLEMVYHAYRTSGGPALVFKAQTDRSTAEIPSVTSVWPGADFQEREAWDLFGIQFPGHPNLKRILLWEGFDGHPLRKDWREPYYEEEHKPFDSRWPGGKVFRAEETNLFGKNVQYPDDFDLGQLADVSDEALYSGLGLGVNVEPLANGSSNGLQTDTIVVNMGPHHPSTHGVFRMVTELRGETIHSLEPVMGYLHRNHEKIGERNAWLHNMPFTDRLDYISSMGNNLGYALAVEQLMSRGARYKAPPYRAEVIRVLMAELTRIVNHLWAVGFLLNDLGAFFTPMLYANNTREKILDVFEAAAGSRLMCNYMRFGGVYKDIPERLRSVANLVNDKIRDLDFMQFLGELVRDAIPRAIDELDDLLTENEILRTRCEGVGILPAETAIAYSTAGPLLRASGVAYDVRRAEPYSIYPDLDFAVCTRPNGDIYDRYLIRIDEMRESVKILKQILPLLEQTAGQEIMPGGKPGAYMPRVPVGEAYGRVENPKGELGYYVVSAGDPKGPQNPWRYHIRATSFINLTVLGTLCQGHKVADVVTILGSIDIVLGEVDR